MPKNSTITLSKPFIGVSGTNASGKDLLCNYLVENKNFYFISVSDSLRAEAKQRNLPVTREVLRNISSEWRTSSGDLGVLVHKSLDIFNRETGSYSGLVIASIRNPGEVEAIHKLSGLVIWIDANSKIRYERILNNDRGRSEEDQKTYEQFIAEEQAEISKSGDDTTLNLTEVAKQADIKIINESSTENFYQNIDTSISPYLSRFSL